MWNPDIQDAEEAGLAEAVEHLKVGLTARGDWAVDKPAVAKRIRPGDTIFLRRVGGSQSDRGVVADAVVLSEPFRGKTYRSDEDKSSLYVELEWINLQPDAAMPSSAVGSKLSVLENQGGSGMIVDPLELEALETAWQNHLASEMVESAEDDEELGDLFGATDVGRRYAYREVRSFQASFRHQVLTQWGAQCYVCRLDQIEIIQAAHLKAHAEGGAAHWKNGRPLCANHHLAFDRGLMRWNSTDDRFEWLDGVNGF